MGEGSLVIGWSIGRGTFSCRVGQSARGLKPELHMLSVLASDNWNLRAEASRLKCFVESSRCKSVEIVMVHLT